MKKSLPYISFIVQQKMSFNLSEIFLCCISGGQDSICLLVILYHLKTKYKYPIQLLYCNHLWQTKNFYATFQLLKLAYLLQIPINIIISNTKLKSEDQGHVWRQKTFCRLGKYFNTNLIFLGHSLNDQIETALWHFLRGTSPKGLISLKKSTHIHDTSIYNSVKNESQFQRKKSKLKFYKKNIQVPNCLNLLSELKIQTQTLSKPTLINASHVYYKAAKLNFVKNQQTLILGHNIYYIHKLVHAKQTNSNYKCVRPLLDFSRSTITKICKTNTLPIINDSTNQSKKLMRNKIRLIFLPLLHYYINRQSEIQIKKYISITEHEQYYLETLSSTVIQSYLSNPELVKSVIFLPRAIQSICIKKFLEVYTRKQIKINHCMLCMNRAVM